MFDHVLFAEEIAPRTRTYYIFANVRRDLACVGVAVNVCIFLVYVNIRFRFTMSQIEFETLRFVKRGHYRIRVQFSVNVDVLRFD